MVHDDAFTAAAELFKVLGNKSRMLLLHHLEGKPQTVGDLVALTQLTQPLVSQHLRMLRTAGLVNAEREGKTVIYSVADHHVTHVLADALAHVEEK